MQSDSAEAWGYALLLTRRVLTTALAGATEDQLHRVTPIGSLADCASEACGAEAQLIWPEDLAPAQLDPPQTPVQIMYALVRHRAVTEEILMRASDETMEQAWWTRAKRLAQDPEADADRVAAGAGPAGVCDRGQVGQDSRAGRSRVVGAGGAGGAGTASDRCGSLSELAAEFGPRKRKKTRSLRVLADPGVRAVRRPGRLLRFRPPPRRRCSRRRRGFPCVPAGDL